MFDDIKKKGSALSGLNRDKWNPSDLMIIKQGITVPNCDSLIDFNKWVHPEQLKEADVIGISLKDSHEHARHGKCSLASLDRVTNRQLFTNHRQYDGFDDDFKRDMTASLKSIASHLSQVKVYNLPTERTFDACIETNKKLRLAVNYFRSLPVAIDGLANLANNKGLKDKDDLTAVITDAYCIASSTHANSCSYYKCEASHMSDVHRSTDASVKIRDVFVPLTKDASIVFMVTVDKGDEKTDAKISLRSDGRTLIFEVEPNRGIRGQKQAVAIGELLTKNPKFFGD
jgi:hypothetical protein